MLKWTSAHGDNMWIKQQGNPKIWDFATAFHVRKRFATFDRGLWSLLKPIPNEAFPLFQEGWGGGGVLSRKNAAEQTNKSKSEIALFVKESYRMYD